MYIFLKIMKNLNICVLSIYRTGNQGAPASASGAGGLPLDQSTESNPQLSNFTAPRPMVAGNDALNVGATSKPDFRYVLHSY